MKQFELITPIEKMPEDQLLLKIKETVMGNDDLKIAMLAGCDIETLVTDSPDGGKTFTVRTKNPVSILKSPTGKIISVGELVNGKIVIK